jgi:hypothetical protein
MSAFVAFKEGENELRAIVTAIRTKCLREHWQLADQNARRYDNCDKPTPPHRHSLLSVASIAAHLQCELARWQNRYPRTASGRNLSTAMTAIRMKIANTAACVIANGGSDCVGANALRTETFTKLCTTRTKTFK